MTSERWEQLLEKLRGANLIESEVRDETDGVATHTVVSRSPTGRVKLEFILKPKFLGMQTNYTRRVGSSVTTKPQYSSDETVTVLNVYEWKDEQWIRMDEQKQLFH